MGGWVGLGRAGDWFQGLEETVGRRQNYVLRRVNEISIKSEEKVLRGKKTLLIQWTY